VARENQKSLCFICGKIVANDSSKRRLHIGRHILKALRNVVETPIPLNTVTVGHGDFILHCGILMWAHMTDLCVSVWDLRQTNVTRKLYCDIDQ
jgi:hypothetical protein